MAILLNLVFAFEIYSRLPPLSNAHVIQCNATLVYENSCSTHKTTLNTVYQFIVQLSLFT